MNLHRGKFSNERMSLVAPLAAYGGHTIFVKLRNIDVAEKFLYFAENAKMRQLGPFFRNLLHGWNKTAGILVFEMLRSCVAVSNFVSEACVHLN